MAMLRDLRKVDANFATSGPNATTLRQHVAAPAADLFRCLEDGPAWNEWLGIDVEWTSDKPFGIGTTRTVTVNRQTLEAYFLAWEDGRRMNFRFDRTTLPMAAFAEDYLIEPKGEAACELVWSYAFEWAGPLKSIAGPLFAKAFAFNATRSLKKLAAMMESSGTRFSA